MLASPIQASLGISQTWLFGAFTVGMLVSGATSPLAGRRVDERGGSHVLAAGSLVGAFAFLALAPNAATFVFGWVLGGVAMAATLYDPAFATLHQLSREHYRRSVTALTLIAGFASTVFWPFTGWLEGSIGWRATFSIFALLHLMVCLTLHRFVVSGGKGQAGSKVAHEVSASWAESGLAIVAILGFLIAVRSART